MAIVESGTPGATLAYQAGRFNPAEVLRLIARGLSNTEISDALVIAEQTTKTYVGRILAKLGLRDRPLADAVAMHGETNISKAFAAYDKAHPEAPSAPRGR